ncbi:MAG: AAA family ATPase [Methanocellales archaeon]|nr:AAA family ATPase [Methanocellales archaeon]
MNIIGFVGLPASGKTEAAKVAQKLGIPVIRMGDVVREEVRRRGLDITEENVGKVANDIRAKEGMGAIAKRCIPLIKAMNSDTVAVDGLRGGAEVEVYKNAFDAQFTLIAILASQKNRFARTIARKRSDDVVDWEGFKQKDERELRWGLEKAMKMADILIDNNGTLEEFRENARAVLEGIQG